jgi:serine/threonine protein kinase
LINALHILFRQCLIYDPNKRASPTDLLNHPYILFAEDIHNQSSSQSVNNNTTIHSQMNSNEHAHDSSASTLDTVPIPDNGNNNVAQSDYNLKDVERLRRSATSSTTNKSRYNILPFYSKFI